MVVNSTQHYVEFDPGVAPRFSQNNLDLGCADIPSTCRRFRSQSIPKVIDAFVATIQADEDYAWSNEWCSAG